MHHTQREEKSLHNGRRCHCLEKNNIIFDLEVCCFILISLTETQYLALLHFGEGGKIYQSSEKAKLSQWNLCGPFSSCGKKSWLPVSGAYWICFRKHFLCEFLWT